jgi:hypothetical protein
MTEACDPDADIENLRKTIKMQTGEDVKLTRKQMCEAYDNIHGGKLPLPPLVMTSDRTYLLDRTSPLKHLDYELLFDSATKRSDLKRIARKVGLTSQIEQMTKKQLTDAIGKRLRYLKIREPVKIVSKRLITKDVSSTAVNNTAVNNTAVNNTAVNNNRRNFNNNSAFNNTENRSSNFNNFGNKNNGNRVNGNTNFGNGNRVNGNTNFGNGNRVNGNRVNGNRVNLSGNKKGFTMTNNSGKAQNTLQFPSKLSFKSSFISKNTGNQQPAVQSIPNKVPTSKPSFLSQPQNTGPSAPTPSFSGSVKKNVSFLTKGTNAPSFGGGAKKNTSFLTKGTNAPSFGGGAKKNTSFLTKGTNAPSFGGGAKKNTSFLTKGTGTNVSAPSGPKKGMFNFMKGGAAAGAAGAVAVNASKKCGMFNRMMGRCKKNTGNAGNAGNANRTNNTGNTGNAGNAGNANRTNNAGNTGNVNRTNNAGNAGNTGNTRNTGNTGNVNRDVNYVANKILTEISKDVKNGRLVNNVADDVVDEMLKKEIAGTIDKVANNKRLVNNKVANNKVANNKVANNKRLVNNKVANNKGPVNNKVANNKGLVKNVASEIMNQMLKKDITNSINMRVSRNMKNVDITDDVLKEIMNDVESEINNKVANNKVANNKVANNKVANKDVEIVADQILVQLMNDVKTKIRKGGRAAEPNSNSNSNSNNNKKPIYNSNSNSNNNNATKINNPLFEPNMKNNPMFNLPKEVETQENNVRNMIKNFNNERNSLQNKITKELNMRPNNNGVFRERKGLTKGRIGVWAQELRKAETVDDLKAIENALNKKVELRKNIENKYTKMGLTNQSEKARHRNMVVKFKNDVNARRSEIEEYLTKSPTVMNKGSYQSKVNRLQREFPKGTSPNVRRNWMKKSKIYTGRIQKASKYGDMVKAYNNAMKSFKNLSK